jgi:hypothetical protein
MFIAENHKISKFIGYPRVLITDIDKFLIFFPIDIFLINFIILPSQLNSSFSLNLIQEFS